MQEKHLFEYAVIRIVPRVEREEFLNVGVILYCSKERFLQSKFKLDKQRLIAFAQELDLLQIEKRLQAFDKICAGNFDGGPIAKLPLSSRFRWLTAARSTVVQISSVHPGMCSSAVDTLNRLYQQLVD
ncbi:DUF3037 domain-containing protein [Segetibacter aerophilus]|uniref:DUF3037 domain-containing protein n=1 Tax=Segetibacter aerophilus TaxID=670293 RepID=A0A512BDU8_9BACT|nr:DUF3037 domain-containing protein [Segetibacter aerophilus]GEO10055.1 hypothetical protein SAE01_25510 [Segetibacter aerophilus]